MSNVSFLRSGAQFVDPATAALSAGGAPPRGRNARLVAFEQQMLAAYSQVKVAKTPPPTLVDTAFLRSGRAFEPAAAETPEAKRFAPARATLRGRNARLEDFSAKMLQAFQTQHLDKPGMTTAAISASTTTINTDFLRSGAEFRVATSATPEARRYATRADATVPGRGRNQRVVAFHDKMLAAFAPAPAAPTPTVVNTDFLRSGAEFRVATSATPEAKRYSTRADATVRGQGRNQRAKDFASKMLVAFQAAEKAMADADTPATPVVNTAFLRSSKQFEPATADTAEARKFKEDMVIKGRSTRLESFYNMMLQAHTAKTAAGAAKTAAAVTPEMARRRKFTDQNMMRVNLDYLRTGAEFHQPAAASPQARQYDGYETQGRHARLERFHDRMLAAGGRGDRRG